MWANCCARPETRLAEQGKGEENYRYARQHMNLEVVANAYIDAYGK